jgi:hypothetical protein
MSAQSGVFVAPTMQMTQEDLHQLQEESLPCQAVWKFRRDNEKILASQRLLAATGVKVAYGTDCGMFPFSHGILEFQAMVAAGLTPSVPSRQPHLWRPSCFNSRILESSPLGNLATS